MSFSRRIITISFWPILDWIVTFISHFMLLKFGVLPAVLVTSVVAITLNIIFYHLLLSEEGVSLWAQKQLRKVKPFYAFISKYSQSETLAVLVVYTLSGPAMAGAPLIWLLRIKRARAHFLIVVGIILNSILWTGVIYGTFWRIVRGLI